MKCSLRRASRVAYRMARSSYSGSAMVSPALNPALVSAWSNGPRCYTAHAARPALQQITPGPASRQPANGAAEDQLSILTDGTVTVSSGTVSVGGLAIGTVVSGGANGTDLVVSFNTTDATPGTVSTLIEHIGYANNSANPSTAARSVTFL